MTVEMKRQEVLKEMITKGATTEDHQKELLDSYIQAFDQAHPEHTGLDPYEKAYAVMFKYNELDKEEPAETVPSLQDVEAKSEAVTKPAVSMISAEQREVIEERLRVLQEDNAAYAEKTVINKLIADRSSTKELFGTAATFIPDQDKAKALLDKYRGLVVDEKDEQLEDGQKSSAVIFKELEDAITAKTPLHIRVSDKISKIIGVNITTGDGQTVQMTMEDLKEYMLFMTNGFVAAHDGLPGAQTSTTTKQEKKDAVKITQARVRLLNRKETEEQKNIEVSTEKDGTTMSMYNVRSDLSFKVYVMDGQNKVLKNPGSAKPVYKLRTISIPGRIEAPKLVRKSAYVEKFPLQDPVLYASGKQAPVGKAAENLREKHIEALASFVNTVNPKDVSADIRARLEAFKSPEAKPMENVVV